MHGNLRIDLLLMSYKFMRYFLGGGFLFGVRRLFILNEKGPGNSVELIVRPEQLIKVL